MYCTVNIFPITPVNNYTNLGLIINGLNINFKGSLRVYDVNIGLE